MEWELEKVTLGRCCDYISDSPQSVPASWTFFYAKVPSKQIIPQDLGDRWVAVLLGRDGSGGVSRVQVVEIRGPEILGLCGVVR